MRWMAMPLLLLCCRLAFADGFDLASSIADRRAIERVYYEHRTGSKPPFAQTLSQATLENLVRKNSLKESVLQKTYGVGITPELLNREVERINATTRAPEMLAEIKAALGNDPARLARAFARPILVERLLHERFVNDDSLHSPQRRACELIRNSLLADKTNGVSPEALLARLKGDHPTNVTQFRLELRSPPVRNYAATVDDLELKKRFGPNAQLLPSPQSGGEGQKQYFEDLPGNLQIVLRAQLRLPGDVSAVIETPTAFLLFLCEQKDAQVLRVASLSLPKRDYEQWLSEQPQAP